MSILAQPRRKVRKVDMVSDPKNERWVNDDSNFGKKMLETMGWEKGKGLGKNLHGRSSNLQQNPNKNGKGLGAGPISDYDSTWIAHHDDFADLLSALNQNKKTEEKEDEDGEVVEEKTKKLSLELSSRSLKRRIHYQKFTRAKDMAGYDEQAKKAVLGHGLTTRKVKEEIADESIEKEKSSSDSDENPLQLAISNVSVGDYFKDKMAAKLAALKAASKSAKIEIKEEIMDAEYTDSITQYDGTELVVKTEIKEEMKECIIDEYDAEIAEKKRKKQERKEQRRREKERIKEEEQEEEVEEVQTTEEGTGEEEVQKKKKKKSKKEKREEEVDEEMTEEKRDSRKRQIDEEEVIDEESAEKLKTKKNKKSKRDRE